MIWPFSTIRRLTAERDDATLDAYRLSIRLHSLTKANERMQMALDGKDPPKE